MCVRLFFFFVFYRFCIVFSFFFVTYVNWVLFFICSTCILQNGDEPQCVEVEANATNGLVYFL